MRALVLLALCLVLAAPVAAADPVEDLARGDCLATSSNLHVSLSIQGCLNLLPTTGPLPV